jgi:DNA-binding GntR family transcriptional regulator
MVHMKIQRQMLADEAYEVLKAQLMNLEIGPAERINLDALSRALGVSVTPIREGLARLEAEGLVQKTPLIGYAAASLLSSEQLAAMYEVRFALEPLAAAHAATRATELELDEIERSVISMRTAATGTRWEDYRALALEDARFHRAIAEASRNEFVAEGLGRLHAHLHLYRLYFHQGIDRLTLEEHEPIAGALRRRDPQAAREAMLAHLATASARLHANAKADDEAARSDSAGHGA